MQAENKEILREDLKKLHAELPSAIENLDENLHELLREVAEDIEQIIGGESVEAESGRERLEKLTVKFETDHPRLANILGEIADTLSKLGI
ncbi:MAG: DUF4404 family protein [Gammaproteobacteria bacterium]